jgi:hypothetical protein
LGAVAYGVVVSGVVAALALALILREDTGSGVFATALSALVLGFGPLHAATGRRLALSATLCGLAALLVDIYLLNNRW